MRIFDIKKADRQSNQKIQEYFFLVWKYSWLRGQGEGLWDLRVDRLCLLVRMWVDALLYMDLHSSSRSDPEDKESIFLGSVCLDFKYLIDFLRLWHQSLSCSFFLFRSSLSICSSFTLHCFYRISFLSYSFSMISFFNFSSLTRTNCSAFNPTNSLRNS